MTKPMRLSTLSALAWAKHEAVTDGERELCAAWERMFPVTERTLIEYSRPDSDAIS